MLARWLGLLAGFLAGGLPRWLCGSLDGPNAKERSHHGSDAHARLADRPGAGFGQFRAPRASRIWDLAKTHVHAQARCACVRVRMSRARLQSSGCNLVWLGRWAAAQKSLILKGTPLFCREIYISKGKALTRKGNLLLSRS